MSAHFKTFITDNDLEMLQDAGVDTVRIPVSYYTFLPEANRTDVFPQGEGKGLDT
jgi:aryl-phospho-beta-D-glucosidase BglC (GH1 family)